MTSTAPLNPGSPHYPSFNNSIPLDKDSLFGAQDIPQTPIAPTEQDDMGGDLAFFQAPLNTDLLSRDYQAWKRGFAFVKQIFSQNAIQYQGIQRGSVVLASGLGFMTLKLFPLMLSTGIAAVGAMKVAQNVLAAVSGTNSMQERSEMWAESKKAQTTLESLKGKVKAITGTDSISSRVKSVASGAFAAYVSAIGIDLTFNTAWNFTYYPVKVLTTIMNYGLSIPNALIVGGIPFLGMALYFNVMKSAQKEMDENMQGIFEDLKFSSEFKRLSYASDEEFENDLVNAMGVATLPEFEELKQKHKDNLYNLIEIIEKNAQTEENPREKLLLQLKLSQIKSVIEEGVQILNRNLAPALAQLIVLQQDKKNYLKEFEKLKETGKLKEADQLMRSKIKPNLFSIQFLKHTLLDPTTPPMGQLMEDGRKYYSYVSLLAKQEIQWDLEEVDPSLIEQEASNFLTYEAAIQKKAYFDQACMKQSELLQQQIAEFYRNHMEEATPASRESEAATQASAEVPRSEPLKV